MDGVSLEVDPPAASESSDVRTRTHLGPRLRSYLASGHFLNLGNTSEPEHKLDTEDQWPDLVPNYDESTVAGNVDHHQWILALRNRLFHYHDVPLGVAYNPSLLWLTDECIRLANEGDQLKAQILDLEQQNRDLNRTKLTKANSVHRLSRSYSGGTKRTDVLSQAPKRQHSKSTSNISGLNPANGLRSFFRDLRRNSHDRSEETFRPPTPKRLESPLSSSSKHGLDETHHQLPEEEELKARQEAAVELANYVANQARTNFEDHYSAIAKILKIPSTIPMAIRPVSKFEEAVMGSDEDTSSVKDDNVQNIGQTEDQMTHEGPSRRLFSFYPGDDNVLESLERYSAQQPPSITVQAPSIKRHPPRFSTISSQGLNSTQTTEGSGLAREDSQVSAITVVKIPSNRSNRIIASDSGVPLDSKNPGQRSASCEKEQRPNSTEQRVLSHESKLLDKRQTPIAAAIAATARFGKGGKSGKKTLRKPS